MSKPIAILDSGVGGLTVVREILRQLPREEIIYLGDTARCPYGSREEEEIKRFSYQLIDFLLPFNPKMIVIACNTATAYILEDVSKLYPIPIVGVIHPGVRTAIKSTINGRIGVVGTEATIQSKLYEKALYQIHPQLYVTSLACPALVPLVEKGDYHSPQALQIVEEALAPMQKEEIDTLILGCTHYPLLTPLIQRVLGEKVKLISSADETAREVSTILFHKNILSQTFARPKQRFFASGDIGTFQRIAEGWLETDVQVEQIHFP